MTIEMIKERQESELINNPEYGLLTSVVDRQRITTAERGADAGRPRRSADQGVEGAGVLPRPPAGASPRSVASAPAAACRRRRSTCSARSSSRGAACRSSRRTRCRSKTARPSSSCCASASTRQGVVGLFQPGLAGRAEPRAVGALHGHQPQRHRVVPDLAVLLAGGARRRRARRARRRRGRQVPRLQRHVRAVADGVRSTAETLTRLANQILVDSLGPPTPEGSSPASSPPPSAAPTRAACPGVGVPPARSSVRAPSDPGRGDTAAECRGLRPGEHPRRARGWRTPHRSRAPHPPGSMRSARRKPLRPTSSRRSPRRRATVARPVGLRRPRRAPRVPDPVRADQRPPVDLARQRSHDTEAADRDRSADVLLRARELQCPPRRAHLAARSTDAYEGARASVARFIGAEPDEIVCDTWHDRGDQPRRADLGAGQHRRGRRDHRHPPRAPRQHRSVEAAG